jgi:hypothetical protein
MKEICNILPPSETQKKPQYSSSEVSDEEDEDEDIRDLEGRTYTKMGREVGVYIYICIVENCRLVQVGFFILWVLGMLIIQFMELSHAGRVL